MTLCSPEPPLGTQNETRSVAGLSVRSVSSSETRLARNGSGTVTSTPAGITCGATCGALFTTGSTVTLAATPAAGSIFAGWGGGSCTGTGTCTLTLSAALTVTATFNSTGTLTLATALDNPALVWTTGGNAPWAGQATVSFFGGSAARSGAIGNNQTSYVETAVAGPATLSWYWKVSSESGYDYAYAYLDTDRAWSYSGEGDWVQTSLYIPSGTHRVRWSYEKDGDLASGQDAAWLDKVVYTAVAEDNFPPGGTLPASWVQPAGSSAAWSVDPTTPYAGTASLRAGVIADKHATVDDLEIGDRVAYGGEGTGHGETILTGKNLVARVPDNVPFEHACFTTLGAIALNSIRTSGIGVGDVVAVMGVGLVGQLVAQLARLQGAVVIAIDLRPDRLELAKKLGADHCLTGDSSLLEKVKALTDGRGVDCVIVAAAAKSPVPAQQALQICRDRGRMVIVGAVELDLPWNDMYLKEIQLFMSRAYGPGSYDSAYEKGGRDYPITYVRWTERRNMEEILRLMSIGKLNVQPLITHEFQLEDAPRAYETVMNPASNSLAVVLRYPTSRGEAKTTDFQPVRKVEVTARPAKTGNEVRAALVGAGNLARWAHLPALKKVPNTALQAVYSASGARGKSYANRFQASYCTSDFNQVVNDPQTDFVMIMSRNQEHAWQSVAALRAGKHVFVEKPMALTIAECREIHRAVEASQRQLTVGFNRRFAPFYVELKRALQKRTSPAVLQCRINSPGISGDYWMADPAIGGAILGEACHFVDLMYWLVEAEPVSVMAYSLPSSLKDPIGTNNLVAAFQFADGSVGNLTYCTAGSKTSGGERVEVYAQGVGAVCEDFKRFQLKTGSVSTKTQWWADKGYDAQMQSFVKALRDGATPAVTVRDGIRATVGCLQMLEAARTRQPCALDINAVLLAPPAAETATDVVESTAHEHPKVFAHSAS